MTVEIANHLPIVELLRFLTIGLGSFVIGVSIFTARAYLRLPRELAHYRKHVLLLSSATILLGTGVIVNHAMFEVRDEPFHFGSPLMLPAFVLMGLGMLEMMRVVARRRQEVDDDG